MNASHETNTGDLSSPAISRGAFPGAFLGSFLINGFLKLFSSIWLGVWLLVFLFVYSTVGSVGVWIPLDLGWSRDHDWIHDIYWMYISWTQLHIRQAPGLEMTEFEWFHWWPFNLNILLICVNLVVATIRRIPLNVVNLGVWMIHTGIVTLCIGSVMYFATKLEGDAPIVRRDLVIQIPDHAPVRIAAQPGSQITLERPNRFYHFEITNIDPHWELLSGSDQGKRTYAVQVRVRTPESQFVRTLPAGYPEHIQDALFTGDPQQPLVRAINEIGRAIVDDAVQLSLEYSPADRFFLMDSTAIYLREKGTREWIERPIHHLPRYNDYVDSPSEVWLPQRIGATAIDQPPFTRRSLHIAVPSVDDRDPLAGIPIYVNRYLRYAFEVTRRMPGGNRMDPTVRVRLRSERGQMQDHELVASDPELNRAESNRLAFVWARSREELAEVAKIEPPTLHIRIPEAGISRQVSAIPASPENDDFINIEGTDYSYRVENLQNDLNLGTGDLVSVAIVRIRTPDRAFQRWVFNHPDMSSRDLRDDPRAAMHNQEVQLDRGIEMRYNPGRRPAPVTIIAGPEDNQLNLLLHLAGREPSIQGLRPNERVDLQEGITMELLQYLPYSRAETRPHVVPAEQRERNSGNQRSMIRVEVPVDGGQKLWLPHHVYPFTHRYEVLRRFAFRPSEIRLADGRVIELMYSRRSHPLPTRIALADFRVTSHIGGFTGQTSSIRDWTSIIRFDRDNQWTDPEPVSMNKPANYGGFWYFQAKWDPPDRPRWEGDPPSQGLNYTVLGVGNRNGVWTQLVGCIIAVIGMCYAFYVKPMIKRRRQQAVYATLAAASAGSNGTPAKEENR